MAKALISIGVDVVAGMPPLRYAAADAIQIANWGRNHGFDAFQITDDDAPVTLARVFSAASSILAADIYDQITVYFSGRARLASSTQELWLLSEATRNPNEAIDVRVSERVAMMHMQNVVFISDAFRSSFVDTQETPFGGGVIFPVFRPGRRRSGIDGVSAAPLQAPNDEVVSAQILRGHRTIYSECLLAALGCPLMSAKHG